MNNFTAKFEENEDSLKKFKNLVLLCNGSFSLLLATMICVANIVLIAATVRNPLRTDKVIDKIHNAIFYTNLLTATVFLPYFGVAEILHGLEITRETALFPSYLSSAFLFFAQSNVQASLFILIERGVAFVSPHLHRRMTTKNTVFIILLFTESFLLLFVSLSFTGINETVFYMIYIHVFFSAPILFLLITTFVTYWKLKNRNRVLSSEIPASVEQLEFRKRRSERTARNYLTVVALFLVPIFLCISPWYVVKLVEVTGKHANFITTDVRFVWQRFSITLLFLPDVTGPIILTLRFERYYNSVKRFLRG